MFASNDSLVLEINAPTSLKQVSDPTTCFIDLETSKVWTSKIITSSNIPYIVYKDCKYTHPLLEFVIIDDRACN